jgi:hypothetical protein
MGNMDWKQKTIAISLISGLLIGLAGAFIIIQRAEKDNYVPEVTARDGVKVGLGVLGLLRLVSTLGPGSEEE